jgi:hypothetical protein
VDTLVVYLEAAAWADALAPVTRLAGDLQAQLRPWCPPLTLRLAAGLGFAADPGDGLSFGQSRCRMLAPAVATLIADTSLSADMAIDLCLQALHRSRVNPERPWSTEGG